MLGGYQMAAEARMLLPMTPSLNERFASLQALRWRLLKEGPEPRKARLQRLSDTFEAHVPALLEALRQDLGRHPQESTLAELTPVREELAFALRHVRHWSTARRVGHPLTLFGTRSWVRPEPKGVVLILAPWNYPVYLLLAPLVAALAAGNAVLLKPSEKAPATERALAELIDAAFPNGEVQLVTGGPDVATALLELPFDHLFFTGSTRIGKVVMAAAARHLSSVTLELGGKSPAVIGPGADLRTAARRIAWGKWTNAGQTCVAPDYVLVPSESFAAFTEALSADVQRVYGGAASALESENYSTLIDDAAYQRQCTLLDGALGSGARLVFGGQRDPARRRLAPTVVTDVPLDHPLMQEEIFGPLLPVIPYRTRDEALSILRDRDEPLASYFFCAPGEEDAWLRETRAGGTAMGQTLLHLANPHLPFGGRGPSGLGAYHGEHGFWTFSHARAVLKQGPLEPLRLYQPPYGGRMKSLAFRLLKWMV
jgi:aldehyde dehydrogenase (NAD+)